MASDTSVYEPVMRAWEAMTAAAAPRMTAKGRSASGSMRKKGLRSMTWASPASPRL